MSKRWRKKEDVGVSEGDEPPKKSLKAENDSDDSNQIVVCDLSKNRKVLVRTWMGKIVVDIREYYYKDGKECPGKKGISLTMDQWNALKDHVDDIDEALSEDA